MVLVTESFATRMPTAAFLCQKESGNAFAGMVGRVTGKTAQVKLFFHSFYFLIFAIFDEVLGWHLSEVPG